MKKFMSLLAVCAAFTFAGCSKNKQEEKPKMKKESYSKKNKKDASMKSKKDASMKKDKKTKKSCMSCKKSPSKY